MSFRYFVILRGVFSLFRLFAWRFFVISRCVILSFRVALFRYFACRYFVAKRRKDEMAQISHPVRIVYLFPVYFFTFQYIICRNVLLNNYLFLGHVSCLPFSWYTILLSGTLYVGTSKCLLSTYCTDMHLVYLFHGILFYYLVHYMQESIIALCLLISQACFLSTFFKENYFTFWYIICRNV